MKTTRTNPLLRAGIALLASIALAAGAAPALAAPALAAPVGFVTTLEGIAQIQPQNATTWEPAAIDGSVSVGDSIRTERNSLVKVLLVDDTILTIAEESEVFVDRMIVGDLATQERSILREMRGQVRAQVGSAFGGTTRLEIHTPTAIVGVRGSTMNVKVKRRRGARGWVTVAAIQEGVGFACAKGGSPKRTGDCVDLVAGELSTIPEGAAPSSAQPIPAGFDNSLGSPETVAEASTAEPDVGPMDGVSTAAGGGAGGETASLTGDTLNLTNAPSQNTGVNQGIANNEGTFDGGLGEDGSLPPELFIPELPSGNPPNAPGTPPGGGGIVSQ